MFRWLPNAISVMRIALVPIWVLCVEVAHGADEPDRVVASRTGAVAVLLLIGASDVLDGFLARRCGWQSRLGVLLDAVADKLVQVVVFTWLAVRAGPAFVAVPPWFLVMLVGRDVVLLAGCSLVHRRRGCVRLDHRLHGKAASVLLFALAVACTAGLGGQAVVVLWLATAAVVVSTAAYVRDGVRQFAGGAAPA